MTTRFSKPELNAKQEQLVQYMLDHDLPAAENSLRFAPTSPIMACTGQHENEADREHGRFLEWPRVSFASASRLFLVRNIRARCGHWLDRWCLGQFIRGRVGSRLGQSRDRALERQQLE